MKSKNQIIADEINSPSNWWRTFDYSSRSFKVIRLQAPSNTVWLVAEYVLWLKRNDRSGCQVEILKQFSLLSSAMDPNSPRKVGRNIRDYIYDDIVKFQKEKKDEQGQNNLAT